MNLSSHACFKITTTSLRPMSLPANDPDVSWELLASVWCSSRLTVRAVENADVIGKLNTHSNSSTHWGRVTYICVSNLATIGSDNDGILLIRPLGTNFSEILIENHIFSFKTTRLKLSSAKWRPFCIGLNVLTLKAWAPLNIKTVFPRYGIPMLKIRRFCDRLIFNIGPLYW